MGNNPMTHRDSKSRTATTAEGGGHRFFGQPPRGGRAAAEDARDRWTLVMRSCSAAADERNTG